MEEKKTASISYTKREGGIERKGVEEGRERDKDRERGRRSEKAKCIHIPR